MTQIEEIAKLVFKDGMTEQEFFQQMFAELGLRNLMVSRKISRDQAKKWKENHGGVLVCLYEQEWTKGLAVFAGDRGQIKTNKSPASIWHVLRNSYLYRRYTNFPDYTDEQKKRMSKMLTSTPTVESDEQGGFYFRTLKGWEKPGHSFARFQINADMNPKMIDDLDKFIQRHNSVYKTTSTGDWSDRTDPVNIYMYEPVTDAIKKEIVQIMTPYIRRSLPSYINAIDGELLADGIGYAREATPEECKPLIDKFPPHLRDGVENYLSNLSLGSLKITEEFLDMYKKYAPKLKTNIRPSNIQTQASQHKIPTRPTPQPVRPTSAPQKPQQTPVDKLILQHFKDGKGHSGIRYLDQQGNVVITETYAPNCKTRVYSNGLTMRMWDNPKSTTYTDGSKTGKEATEIMITEAGRGCTKDVSTTGELKRKIEEVRKAGLLVTDLPNTPQKSSTLRGRLMRHSVDNASKVVGHVGGKVSGA